MRLAERTALITGASSGIGRSIAERLAAEGVRLAITARTQALLDQLAAEIEQSGRDRPAVLVADLSERGAADSLADAAVDALGQVDILVNNAGGAAGGQITAVGDRDEGRETFDLNVWSPLALTSRLVPAMRARKAGAVVNVTSIAQVLTWPFMGHYTASKAALASFTETLRLELRGSGVNVLEVIPGPVDTPIFAESQLVPGLPTATRRVKPGSPEILANHVVKALRRDRRRVVYPRPLATAYAIPSLPRTLARIQVSRVADEIDPEDVRVLRSGSEGDEQARAAREAWHQARARKRAVTGKVEPR